MLSLYDQLRSGDREPVEDALKRYDIAWTLFAPDNRVVAALDREPGWRRLFMSTPPPSSICAIRRSGRKAWGRTDGTREEKQRKLGPKAL
jgi:hypothetical protein